MLALYGFQAFEVHLSKAAVQALNILIDLVQVKLIRVELLPHPLQQILMVRMVRILGVAE
jgi:hypothetical protein